MCFKEQKGAKASSLSVCADADRAKSLLPEANKEEMGQQTERDRIVDDPGLQAQATGRLCDQKRAV